MSTPTPGVNYAPEMEPPYPGPEPFMETLIWFCVAAMLKPLYVEPNGLANLASFDWDEGFKKMPTSAQLQRDQYNQLQRAALIARYTAEGAENRRIREEADAQKKRALALEQGVKASRLAASERLHIGVFTLD